MARDKWAEWLAERRDGGDLEIRRRFAERLLGVRDRVLDNAELAAGETLLDVGCGEGLIAFGALERGAEVVFADVSQDLLDLCRERAEGRGRYVLAPADELPLEDESVDVVTTRSVLIYVDDKARAFAEFHRVLRPGGRISLYEPINRFALRDDQTFWGYDLGAVPGPVAKLRAVYAAIQPRDTDPMTDFDERDLIRLADEAGFFPIRLDLEAEIRPHEPRSWESFLRTAGNPRIPTMGEAMEQALTVEERAEVEAHFRPLVESGEGTWRMATAYLWATKR